MQLREALNDHVSIMRRLSEQHGNTATQTINVNAGGWGILIALVMVAFLAGLNISQAASEAKMASEISDIRRRNDVANDKLSVILQWAPELAKKVDDSTNKKGGSAP